MAGLQVTGTIKNIGKTKEIPTKSGDVFKKRAILIEEVDGEYTNAIFAEFTKDKCDVLDKYKNGDEVTLDINIRCNEHEGRYFTNLNAWRISKADNSTSPIEDSVGGADDLPF